MVIGDLIQYAMRIAGVLGVGQTPLDQDTADAESALGMMLEQWQRRRWLVYRLNDLHCAMVPWDGVYSVGPGGNLDFFGVRRPGSIESAFLRQLTGSGGNPTSFPVDYPLRRINSKEEWNNIPLKTLGSWPAQFYYDPLIPLGMIWVWPVPIQTFFELHVSFPQNIDDFDGAQEWQEYYPPEGEEAVAYNLAVRLRANYGLPIRQDLVALATSSLNTLRSTNFAIRKLRMPAHLQPPSRFKNPMSGFYPEASAGISYPVLG